MGKVLAAYGGGFKPPTAGHFEIVKNALQEFPEIDEFFIYVGGKVRDGIDQFEAIQIWDIYKKYLANKVNIQPSKSPIGDILRLAKDNPQDIVYFVIGYREGREDDMQDVAARTSNLKEKYPNIIVKVIPTYDPNMSGTNARKALDNEEEFIKFIPNEVKEKSEVYKLVQKLDEITLIEEWLNEADPKKGTGKKPKGSSRRLYTDEDPKDTVGIKFSTRQDIVDTLGKASFKAKSHARQSQIINLIHQRVRAALGRTKDPDKKKKLKSGFEYIKGKKEASKKKTQRLKKQKKENVAPNHDGKAAPFGSGYDKVKERKGFGGRSRYRAIEKRGDKYYYIQDNPFSPGIRQEFGPYKTKEQAKKKMNSFPPSTSYRDINEGKYDSLVTKLAGFTLNAWKGDFEDGQNKGKFEVIVGPGEDFDYPHLRFKYKAIATFWDAYRSRGVARPMMDLPEVELDYWIDVEELPEKWSEISMDLRNVIRHEIEHLMQSGPNVKKGKEMDPDRAERDEINKISKKPWWKIWRKALGSPDYYKLEKEIDANLQGLYLQAKKSRQPLEDIIDDYLKNELKLSIRDQRDIKALWKERAPKLNIPLEEGDTYEKMAAKGKKAGSLKQGTVRKRLKIPKGKKIPLSKINKELSRLKKMDKDDKKKGVQLGDKNQKYYKALQLSKTLKTTTNVNEGATYNSTIDLMGRLGALTQHMLDKGMNIQPLPTLQIIDSDIENAKQFLGKTAYYDPNTLTIALYTEGRHPKDIARSFAHEMIHHIQNLEGRLGNVETTNTLEDDNLNKLEQEANLRGTMTFRNWTDSLNEVYKHKFGFDDKLGKDPFGLNQFAREIATEVENAMNKKEYKIFSDMDGVITDFNGRFEKYSDGIPPTEYEKTYGKDKFWELADGEGVAFWVGMPWMSDGKQYWNYIKNYDVELLSSPSRSNTSRLGKRLWVRNNLPGVKLTLAQAAKKQNYAAPNHILIDDRESNIEQWRSQGGIGILHTSAADTIKQLKQLGL